MAIEPLYTDTKDNFLLKIRLKSAQSDQTNAVIDIAISEVRQKIFTRITMTRALEIAAFIPADNPTTVDENLIATASVAEALWVTALLMQRLPTVFMEGDDEARQSWNEEPLTRDVKGLDKFINNMFSQVDVLLGQLEIPTNEDTGPVKSFSTGREEPFSILGNSPGRPIRI